MKNINFYESANPNISKTLNSVNTTWTKDQIIRFLYKNLASFVQRDLNYFLQSDEEKQNQFSTGFVNRFPNVVCYTLSEFYCTVFNEFGIEANVVQANSASIPLFAVVVNGDNGKYFLNPLEDLFYNQYGLKPIAFGIVPRFKTINGNCPDLVRLSGTYISELDQSLGFTYLDDYFKSLKPQMKDHKEACRLLGIEDPSLHRDIKEEKLMFFADRLINLGKVDGAFERAQLYQFLNDSLLDRRERRNVKVVIEKGLSDNPFLSYRINRWEDSTIYHEESTPSGYVLKKVREYK